MRDGLKDTSNKVNINNTDTILISYQKERNKNHKCVIIL